MKKLLEDLWYSYQIEKTSIKDSPEKHRLLKESIAKEAELINALNEKQRELLEAYQAAHGNFDCVCEEKIFISGIKFGVSFLFGALQEK